MSESLKAITCPHCGASLEPKDGIYIKMIEGKQKSSK